MSQLSILIGTRPFIVPTGIARPPHYCEVQQKSSAQVRADEMKRGQNMNMVAVAQGVRTRQMILDFLATVETASAKEIAEGVTAMGYRVSVNTADKHLKKLIEARAIEKSEGDRGRKVAAVYWISEGEEK